MSRWIYSLSVTATLLVSVTPALASASVTYNTKYWFAVGAMNQTSVFDYQKDAQTGDPRAELVGNSTNPGFYFAYDSNTNGGLNQGRLLFRVRVAAFDTNLSDQTIPTNAPGEYGSALFIGIDANLDSKIDLFVMADDRGSSSSKGVKIYFPDCGNSATNCFTGPSTTNLGAQHPGVAPFVTTGTNANFNWAQVSSTTDPRANLDTDVATLDEQEGKNSNYHNPDGFFSFAVDVQTIGNALATLSTPIAFSPTTEMRFITITGQQDNTFNQDTGGCDDGGRGKGGGYATWECAFSNIIKPASYVPSPEPGTYATMGGALVLLGYYRRRRHRKL
ncbi:MAG TPA: hypothetical protein VER03_02735 [Bryobacteraceae bacterium]|nr:hypothetical protein [Bryobacteraceae bacterium]